MDSPRLSVHVINAGLSTVLGRISSRKAGVAYAHARVLMLSGGSAFPSRRLSAALAADLSFLRRIAQLL